MPPKIEILGVHFVKAEQPVHLIEILVRDSEGPFDMSKITQPMSNQPRTYWQVPYDDQILNAEGTKIVADAMFEKNNKPLWTGDMRIAFFFHYLDLSRPLMTPFGEVNLPPETERPKRLEIMEYFEVD